MDELTRHLNTHISYYQNRISLLDNKCTILIAVQAALAAAVTFIVDKICLPYEAYKLIGYMILAVSGLLSAAIIFCLLQTIRPTKNPLTLRTGLPFMDGDGLIWSNWKKISGQDEFRNRVKEMTPARVKMDLEAVAYNQYLLVVTKTGDYRIAMLLAKIQILLAIGGILSIIYWIVLC
ncbi:MAG: hypothetical protein K9M45_11120 [Kiritimatiellales bacterium]|nr:hypothetical protein [Kiritimatiellales bacterium]